MPANPRGWLLTAAHRRLIDELRSEGARRRREEGLAREPPPGEAADEDDTLELLFMCCHESLTPASQVALTLRAVGGLTTAEIASAFLVPESTMAQRISRAKATIRAAGARFAPPAPEALPVVLHVLYLIFNEGYMASSGAHVARVELSAEAMRLTREVHRRLPDDGEVAGLLALMLLTDARRPARARADGSLVALAEQDRSLWDRAKIAEGVALVEDSLASKPGGPYQLQAAIAAIHDEAPSARETDWRQILAVYEVLERVSPGPVVTLNRAVAVAMVRRSTRGTGVAGDARRTAARPPPSGGRARPSPGDGRRRGRRPRGVRARRSPHQRAFRSDAISRREWLLCSGPDPRSRDDGLVRRVVRGREHILSLDAAPLADVVAWTDHYRAFWSEQLASLDAFVTGGQP